MGITSCKKGGPMYLPSIVLGIFIVLTLAFVVLNDKQMYNREIGEKQFMLFDSYQEGEEILFFVKEAGRYTAYQTPYELAANGGYSSSSQCGNFAGFVLWNNQDEECFPDFKSTKQEFTIVFNKILNSYTLSAWGISNEYWFELTSNDDLLIKAFPNRSIDILTPMVEEEEKIIQLGDEVRLNMITHSDSDEIDPPEDADLEPDKPSLVKFIRDIQVGDSVLLPIDILAKYSVYPIFKASVSYNFEEYDTISDHAKKLLQDVEECKLDVEVPEPPNVIYSCIMEDMPSEWRLEDSDETHFAFEVDSAKSLWRYDDNSDSYDLFPVVYRFALYVEPLIPSLPSEILLT